MLITRTARLATLSLAPALMLGALTACTERTPTAPEPSFARENTPERNTFHDEINVTFTCGAFDVSAVGTFDVRETLFFDQTGALTTGQYHVTRRVVLTNLSTGETITDRAAWNERVDFATLTAAIAGKFIILQGEAHVRDVGRLVVNIETGEVLFEAGPKDALEVPLLDPLACAAFGA